MKAPIVGILNSYCPATGGSVSNLLIRADGTLDLYGDRSLAKANILRLLEATLPEASDGPIVSPVAAIDKALALPVAPVPRPRLCRACGHANEAKTPSCASCTAPLPRRGRPPKARS